MFQGSFESNFNYGKLIVEAMNAVPFDAMAVGNHEFDYGRDKLAEAAALADFPFLAGNIRKVDKTTDMGDCEEFDAYHIIERGGFKFGIVGMIGEGQTTSITSRHVSDLAFANPEYYALHASEYLKDVEGCDAVFLVIHDDASSVASWDSASTLDLYFDGVFCGHSHTKNKQTLGGLVGLQAYCNGEAYSHLKITVGPSGVNQVSAAVTNFSSNLEESAEIGEICDKYFAMNEYSSKANAVAGTLSGGYLTNVTVSDLACKAIYKKAVEDYPTLLLAMQNKQRASIAQGEVTYRDLYKAMPFMNKIYIVDILGEDILKEAKYNETYSESITSINKNEIYRIAVIDYLLFHQDTQKEYDYFSHLGTSSGVIINYYDEIPVDITYDYIQNTLHGQIVASDYNGSSANGFNVFKW